MKRMIVLFSLVASTLSAQNLLPPSINVTGEGTVLVIPDMVNLSVEIMSEGQDVRKVKSENDEAVKNVAKFLKDSGIDQKDYKTQYVNLRKQYDYNTKKYLIQASQSIFISLKDLGKYDAIIQGLLESGVNRINSVDISTSDKSTYYTQARKKAILMAKQKAEEYAETLGQSIGKAIQITDVNASTPYVVNHSSLRMLQENTESNPSLMSGTLEIKSQINVSFELK